jgi:hypothetical protein
MQICNNCRAENPEGEMFCYRCGVSLGLMSISTAILDGQEDEMSAGGDVLSTDRVVYLHFAGHSDPMILQVNGQVLMGRESGEGRLNLERFEAVAQGVSRQHAAIYPEGAHLYLRDLNSTNKTYLNGQQLVAGDNYLVHDGDEIMLGRLVVKVFFK